MDWNFLIKNKDSLSVSTDTRNLPAGCVFFALHGETFDGNRFAAQALDNGAAMAIVSDEDMYNQLVEKYGKERAILIPFSLRERGGGVLSSRLLVPGDVNSGCLLSVSRVQTARQRPRN